MMLGQFRRLVEVMVLWVLVLGAARSATGDVWYLGNANANIFSTGMVLQRGLMRVWGGARPDGGFTAATLRSCSSFLEIEGLRGA